MKNKIFIYLLFLLLTACSGAMKNREMTADILVNLHKQNIDKALSIATDEDYYSEKNSQLLKNLEIATLHYRNGNYYQSLKYFEKAKKISDDLYTVSISKKLAGTWDANLDNYYGEKYERSAIRFYLSLINYNLYKQGYYEEYTDENGVFVPKKELTNNEKKFHLTYARSAIIEWDSFLKTMQNETAGISIFKNDMLAKLWGAFIHSEYNTSVDNQISLQLYKDADELLLRNYNMYPIFNNKSDKFNDDFKKLPTKSLQQLYKTYIEKTDYSKDIKEYIARNKKNLQKYKKDKLFIVLKDSVIAPKVAAPLYIPLPIASFSANIYDFAVSVLYASDGRVPNILIEVPLILENPNINKYVARVFNNNGEEVASTNLTLVQPMSNIAKKTLSDELAAIQTAIIARVTSKYVAAIISAYAAYDPESPLTAVAAKAIFIAGATVANETSRADIRYWSTLFSNAQFGGMQLANGKYKLKIYNGNKVIYAKDITIKNNETAFIDINI